MSEPFLDREFTEYTEERIAKLKEQLDSKWTSIKDGLPDHFLIVAVTLARGTVTAGYRDKNVTPEWLVFARGGVYYTHEVIKWMPMPEIEQKATDEEGDAK